MSSKTKIVVLRMKELIYTGIFVAMGILLIILLVFMFAPKNKTTKVNADPAATGKYTPGVYTSVLSLNNQARDVEVAVDSDYIKSVRFVNLSEDVAAMYPLMAPSMENLASQVVENQGLSGLSYDESTQYTSMALTEAIGNALKKAETGK